MKRFSVFVDFSQLNTFWLSDKIVIFLHVTAFDKLWVTRAPMIFVLFWVLRQIDTV
jgi:hypothetical protein